MTQPIHPNQPFEQPATPVSLLLLGAVFLKIGATAFGGLGATLALIERELVVGKKWLTTAEVTEALTYTKLLPGSTGPQAISYLGYKLGGWRGSAIATTAFLIPSAVIMLAAAVLYFAVADLSGTAPFFNGLAAGVTGILITTTYRFGKTNIKEPWMLAVAITACIAGAFFGVNAAVIVVAAGLIGIQAQRFEARKQTKAPAT